MTVRNSKVARKTPDEKDTLNSVTSLPNLTISEKKSSNSKVIQLNAKENTTLTDKTEEITADTKEESGITKKSLNRFALTDTKNLPFSSSKKNSVAKPEITESKFTVATIFAPIYFNSFGNGSGADSQFNNNQTSGSSSYSYGVKLAYQLNSKFSVQSGISLINLGQTTNDIYITPGVAVVSFSNISNIPVLGKADPNVSKESIDLANENGASLNQVFGYIEIPVEVKYNIADGKFGINLVGGFSTLLLNNDEVLDDNSILEIFIF